MSLGMRGRGGGGRHTCPSCRMTSIGRQGVSMLKKTLGSNPVEWSDRHCGTWASASLPTFTIECLPGKQHTPPRRPRERVLDPLSETGAGGKVGPSQWGRQTSGCSATILNPSRRGHGVAVILYEEGSDLGRVLTPCLLCPQPSL